MTSGFSSAITEQLIEQLSDLHMNLIIEGKLAEVPRKTAKLLAERGIPLKWLSLPQGRKFHSSALCCDFI